MTRACRGLFYTAMSAKQYQAEKRKWAARRDRIRAMLASGVKVSEIVEKYGISRQRVHQLANKDGNGRAK